VLAEGVDKIAEYYYQRKSYPAAIGRYKEIVTKYPDYSRMSDSLYNLAESLHDANNDAEAAIYYARIVSDHPLSDRVPLAKRRLTALNMPIPEANPVALARAQALPHEDKSILGRMFAAFYTKPPVNTRTAAASTAVEEENSTAPTGVRGGTSGGGGTAAGDGSGDFSIDPKVVQPGKQQPVKKLR
jgi:hypothetical protein